MKKRYGTLWHLMQGTVILLVLFCMHTMVYIPALAAAKDCAGDDCVKYARAWFGEYWGFELHWPNGNAKGYYYNASSFGDAVSSAPTVGALAVWGDNGGGHVAFVEQINGNKILISEGGCLGKYNEREFNLSNMDISWTDGAGYHCQNFLSFICVKGTTSAMPMHVDIGTNFYAIILHTQSWKPLTYDYVTDYNISLRAETGAANQYWYFQRESDGSYKISSVQNKYFLDVDSAGSIAGTNVGAWTDNISSAQRWFVYGTGGAYTLRPACADCVLDLTNNDSTDGSNIQIFTPNQSAAQKYAIYKVDLQSPTLTVTGGEDGTPVCLTWDKVLGTVSYHLQIWKKDAQGEILVEEKNTSQEQHWQATLPSGNYVAQIEACNAIINRGSNKVPFTVNIKDKTLLEIAITQQPNKTNYIVGSNLDLTGLIVTAIYDNGDTEIITDYEYSGFDSSAGLKTVTVSYKGKTAAFPVTVKEDTTTRI